MADDDVVVANGLTKRFHNGVLGVGNLDLRVRRGEVFGFLGPNGAGKTTTLRMLVGLIRPTEGTLTVAGHPAGSARSLAQVGSLIESPAFYPHLSGRDNLRLLARYCGIGDGRAEEALAEAGLTGAAGRAYRTYSLGMKQRLGVASVLLKDPSLLIMDEPTNGLDPAGMASMRELVRSLKHERRAVLLSSHLLSEVEQLCDRVAVIRSGRLIAQGTLGELRAGATGGSGVLLRATPYDRAVAVLRGHRAVSSVEPADDGALRLAVEPALIAQVNRDLVLEGIDVMELRPYAASLEEVFLQLTDQEHGAAEVAVR
jgi:ABC-type multidrug transport system ATPase subunit